MKLALVALAVALAGCQSWIDDRAASSTYRILEQSLVAARREADVEVARAAMPAGLVQLQAFALAYPAHREFRVLYAASICDYEAAFVFDAWEDADLGHRDDERARLAARLAGLSAECVEASLVTLAPSWRAARLAGVAAWSAAFAHASATEAPALLAIATNDAIALAIDPAHHLTELGAIIDELSRCAQLAPGAHDAGAEILLGTLQAARARFMPVGGDGTETFARAREVTGGGVLMIDVMFARGVAVARGDRTQFEAMLHGVLAADLARWPERRLGNELAQLKARRYLAAEDALFAQL